MVLLDKFIFEPLANTKLKIVTSAEYKKYYHWKLDWKAKGKIKQIQKYLFSHKEEFPLFNFIEIETQNRCNGTCSFCPVNRNDDPRDFSRMSEKLFESILQQLSDLQYRGYLALFSNNEPLLDKRIYTFAKMAREALPFAKLYMITNGTRLTTQNLDGLMNYLDKVFINDYSDTGEPSERMKTIRMHCQEKDFYGNKVSITVRDRHAVLGSRGGNAPNKTAVDVTSASCILPFIQFVVRADGKISLCCNDALGQTTMGDLTKESIVDVWRNQRYIDTRNKLYASGRGSLAACEQCDAISSHLNFYPVDAQFEDDIQHL